MEKEILCFGKAAQEAARNIVNPNYLGYSPLQVGDECSITEIALTPDNKVRLVLQVTRVDRDGNEVTFNKILPASMLVNKHIMKDGVTVCKNTGSVVAKIQQYPNYYEVMRSMSFRTFRVERDEVRQVPRWTVAPDGRSLVADGDNVRMVHFLELNFCERKK